MAVRIAFPLLRRGTESLTSGREREPPNPFFDRVYGENMWEQYFEPIGEPSYQELREMIADPDSPITKEHVIRLPTDEMLHVIEHDPNSIYSWTFAEWRRPPP